MAEELESLSLSYASLSSSCFSQSMLSSQYLTALVALEEQSKQFEIKESMEKSHLETKINLLKETLTKK